MLRTAKRFFTARRAGIKCRHVERSEGAVRGGRSEQRGSGARSPSKPPGASRDRAPPGTCVSTSFSRVFLTVERAAPTATQTHECVFSMELHIHLSFTHEPFVRHHPYARYIRFEDATIHSHLPLRRECRRWRGARRGSMAQHADMGRGSMARQQSTTRPDRGGGGRRALYRGRQGRAL